MRIAAVGDNCVDYYVQMNKGYPGGNPVNVSVYTVRLGHCASYIGVVGNDDNGALIRSALERKGVDITHLHTLPGNTAITEVELKEGDRVFRFYSEGVTKDFVLTEDDIAFVAGHDLMVTGMWGKIERSLPHICEKGVPIAFDFANHWESPVAETAMPYVDYAFLSDDQLEEPEAEALLRSICKRGPHVAVLTRGRKGSLCYDGNKFYRFGIISCEVRDTMGAGDSYIAGFLISALEGLPYGECMEAGARSSSLTLQYFGAWEP